MRRQVAAELKKFRTIWSTWLILGITAFLVAALTAVVAFAPHGRRAGNFPVTGTARWFDSIFSPMAISLTLALVLGILCMTGEYRHKTITPTYLAQPRRGRVVSAKLLASGIGGAVVGVVGGAVSLVYGFSVVGGGDGNVSRMLTEYRHVFPGVLVGAILYALYGVGLGSLLKNQVVAIIVGLGFTAIVEPILVGVVPSVGRWLPGQLADSLESVTAKANGINSSASHLVASWEGGLALLGYGIVLAAAGSFTTLRSDVT